MHVVLQEFKCAMVDIKRTEDPSGRSATVGQDDFVHAVGSDRVRNAAWLQHPIQTK